MTISQETRISLVEQDLKRNYASLEKMQDSLEKHREESTQSNNRVYDRMEDLRQELKEDLLTLKKQLDEQINAQNDILNKIDTKLNDIDKWRWIVVGAATIVGFIVSQITSVFGWTLNSK